ncbi:MAG TPA: VWA domain-containing protein [bacterium]|nr:VWA domain-containing protein [Candidatus Omnitrophota bacterium]HOJ59956.1 VWA domain-containing protein [bacterium]HOL94543.1 VWA domain-containing protein [bacterium]HPP02439.1 VWA domain-containing protein [bacterium]
MNRTRNHPGPPAAISLFPSRKRWDLLLLFCFTVSLALHGIFLYYSTIWEVGDIRQAEKQVETLFKVTIQQLESRDFVSRPTTAQLREERRQALEEQIIALSQINPDAAQREIESLAPEPPAAVPSPGISEMPAWGQALDSHLFVDDQAARQLVTAETSRRMVEEWEAGIGREALPDVAELNPIPLTGRGMGSPQRLLAGLPEPLLREEPAVIQSIGSVLLKNLPPAAPALDISEPPIQLPPVTELLPSPELIHPNPAPATFQVEEAAKEELKDRFVALDDLLQVDLYTYRHVGGDGYFMIVIRPVTTDERLRVLPKDVVFVLDASGSMGSRRLDTIKQEVRKLLDRLRPDDRFNVIGFKQTVKQFTATLAPVTEETRAAAWQFTRSLQSSGRTDIYASLEPLMKLGTERARPLILLLYSDGRPTVGVINSRKIINNLTRYQGPSTSIFCVGTGDYLNQYLLDMLAFRNRGLVAFEKNREALPDVIQSVFSYIEDPLLLQIQASLQGVDENEVYPKRLPQLFLKGDLRIWGRLQNQKSITLRLVGEAYDEHKEIVIELPVPARDNGTYEIARQWAFHKIYHIVGEMVREGERPEFLEQIRFLSQTYRITTPYSEQFEK